jgi:hypothetical protein
MTAVEVLLAICCQEVVNKLRYSSSIMCIKLGEVEHFGVGSWGTTQEVCFGCFVAVAEEGPGVGRVEEVAFTVFLCDELITT